MTALAGHGSRNRRRLLTAGALAGLLAGSGLLAGCGFRLRGSVNLPFHALYVAYPANSPIGANIRRQIRSISTTRLVDKPEEADARLEILMANQEKEIVAYSSTGRPREYQLRLRFRFRLLDAKGEEWIEPTEIVLRREVTTSDAQLSAKQQEDILLYDEMQSDVVNQLMRRLEAARARP